MAEKSRYRADRLCWYFAASLLALVIDGCATSPQSTNYSAGGSNLREVFNDSRRLSHRRLSHTVQPGETVYHIARAYGVSPARLMEANGLNDPRQLRVGQSLVIPGGSGTSTLSSQAPEMWTLPHADRQFSWPVVSGMVSSPFGMRSGVMHDGIDIVAPAGTLIYAVDDGSVIFVGHLRGYGNAVILQHSDGYVTVYGHNQRNLVRYGSRVARGQEIAELGSTGRASGPNLHFEVRYHGQAQNPLAYLLTPPSSGISFARNGGS